MKNDTITTALAILLVSLETIARGAFAAYVLGRQIRRAWCATAPKPLAAPYVHPLYETLAPLTCAQLRTIFSTRRRMAKVQLLALAVC